MTLYGKVLCICSSPVATGRKLNVKTSRTSSERLMNAQFTCCLRGHINQKYERQMGECLEIMLFANLFT